MDKAVATPFNKTVEFGGRCSCGSLFEVIETAYETPRRFFFCQVCDNLELE